MSAVQKHAVTGKVSDLLTFKKKLKSGRRSLSHRSWTHSLFPHCRWPRNPAINCSMFHHGLHIWQSIWLVGGQREVFLMLTETCLKAASLDWNLDNPVDQCCFLWVSGGAWQLEGLLVPARGTSQSVGTMGRGPQSPPFPFSLLSASPPSMTHLLTQPARENPCLQYSIFNDNQITCRFYSLKQQKLFFWVDPLT